MSVVITFVFKKYKMTLLLQNAFTVTIIRHWIYIVHVYIARRYVVTYREKFRCKSLNFCMLRSEDWGYYSF